MLGHVADQILDVARMDVARMNIESIDKNNFHHVLRIYQEGIDTGIATFETKPPSWEYWDANHCTFARIIAVKDSTYFGWTAISHVSKRQVYRGVAEVSIYISAMARRQGVGSFLLERLIMESEQHDIYSLQSSIFPQNEGSIHLHSKHGFRTIGYKSRIAKLHGDWYDNVLMERRSNLVGL